MWSREQLKNDAKAVLKNCFGNSILVCLILSVIGGITNSVSSRFGNININIKYDTFYFPSPAQLAALFGIACVTSAISALVQIFVTNLLSVGGSHFFLASRVRAAQVDLVGFGFQKGRYGNVCKTMFLKNLYTWLWSLLFIIPGIYKSYQYRLVPYLLAENPEMDYNRALSLSASMMEGEKMDAFVLDLSFIGWYLLSALTCGILAVVYVAPYQCHTNAGLYITLREKAINNGLVTPSELYAVVG